MMKKIATVIVSAIMAFSFVSCSGGTSTSTSKGSQERVITWNNHVESCDAYVNDYYKYTVPSAFDQDHAEYEVTSKVYDEDGTQIDNIGNMFLVKEEGTYTIEFAAFDGKKTHTATTVVSALKKTKYSLSNTNFIYGVGETVDLNGKVISVIDGEVEYTVEKDGQKIALTDNAFTPTEEGAYTVTAKLSRQPEYQFEILTVDKAKIPYPSGMIHDDNSAQNMSISTEIQYTSVGAASAKKEGETFYTEEENAIALAAAKAERDRLLQTMGQNAHIATTFDETAKFDENSNGSTKISVDYGSDSLPFDLPIFIKPQFGELYYKSLSNGGYEYVAVRMKVEDVEEIANYGLLFFSAANGKSIAFRRCLQNGTLTNQGADTALWSGVGYQNSRFGWFELLIPITEFITEYSANMQLFKMRTYASVTGYKNGTTKFSGNNGKINIYIDNIYAVKALDGVDVNRGALKTDQDTFHLSELNVSDTADVDTLLFDYKMDGLSESFNGETIPLLEEGDYALEVRARNRYGVRKAGVVVKDTYTLPETSYGVVKEFTSAGDVTVSEVSTVQTTSGGKSATVTYATDVKYDDVNSQGSVCISGIEGNAWADISVKPTRSKAYYQFLKENGYKYITMRLCIIAKENDNAVYLHAGGTTVLHQNAATSTVLRYDTASGSLVAIAGKGELYVSGWTNKGAENWKEISISIDEFLNSYNKQGTPILRVFGSYSKSDIYLDGVYVTKTGTIS